MTEVFYTPQEDGSVLVQVKLDHGRCNLCTLNRDRTIKWFANCPPQDVETLTEVLKVAARHG